MRSLRSQSQASCSRTAGASCSRARASRNVVELLTVAGSGGSPTESGRHQRLVITPSTTFPAAVAGQQSARVVGCQSQQPAEPIDRG
jgi:hypothetical protein